MTIRTGQQGPPPPTPGAWCNPTGPGPRAPGVWHLFWALGRLPWPWVPAPTAGSTRGRGQRPAPSPPHAASGDSWLQS